MWWPSITKSASKKIGALVHFMKFLSPEVGLYVYKSTTRPFMEFVVVIAGFRTRLVELNLGYPENSSLKPRKHSWGGFISIFLRVVTKTINNHKPTETTTNHQQMTTNDHKPPINHHKPPANDHKPPQTTRKWPQTTSKRPQTTNIRP